MDTYKVATVANSTSTMHKLATTPITLECFEIDDYEPELGVGLWSMAGGKEYVPEPDYTQPIQCGTIKCENDDNEEAIYYQKEYSRNSCTVGNNTEGIINYLERLRQLYLETKDKRYWKELIRWLPEGWLQTRTFTCNYAVLRNIVHWRKNHKLKYEWDSFIQWCKTLPYAEELIFYNNGYDEEYKLHNLLSQE